MSRYIDADILREQMYHEAFENRYQMQRWDSGCWIRYKLFENILEQQPKADVVEVVRCKDCENWDKDWISSTFTENAHHCSVLDNVFDGEFYCACGHKRRSF